jgi:hypothetical protein
VISVIWGSESEAAIEESIEDLEKSLAEYKSYGDLEWTVKYEQRLHDMKHPESVVGSETEKCSSLLIRELTLKLSCSTAGRRYVYRVRFYSNLALCWFMEGEMRQVIPAHSTFSMDVC